MHLRHSGPLGQQPANILKILQIRAHCEGADLREGGSDQAVRGVHQLKQRLAGNPALIQARNGLDGTKLLGAICKMNIYFSNFNNVDLKNTTTEGADFTVVEEIKS